jgi:hypothetical protein
VFTIYGGQVNLPQAEYSVLESAENTIEYSIQAE